MMRKPAFKHFIVAAAVVISSPAVADKGESEWTPMDETEDSPVQSAATIYPALASTPLAYEAPVFDVPLPTVSTARAPGQMSARGPQEKRVKISPYLEAAEVFATDLKASGDVLTYSNIVAGIDGSVATHRAQAQVSLRYERRIAQRKSIDDQNTATGLARGSVALTRNFSIEAGGVAARTRVDGRGAGLNNLIGNSDNVNQVYSVYAGPTFSAAAGSLKVNAAYRAGYTKVDGSANIDLPSGQRRFDQFDDSISHVATASISAKPGILRFGWSLAGNWKREDAKHLGSRLDSRSVRGDVILPISLSVALVGGVGFEKVIISERDALRNAAGVPIIGADGRLASDPMSPRLAVYNNEGLIWDSGVMWRPGPRTSVEARFGRRYGTNTYVANVSYRSAKDWAVSATIFDVVSGFGGLLNDNLSALPTQFHSIRNPLSGDIGGCAFGKAGGTCLNDLLQNASSAAFRQRGVTGTFSGTIGGWESGLAFGFNRRTFIAAQLGAQAEIDGRTDDSYFALAYLGKNIGQRTRFESNVYATYYDPSFAGALNTLSTGANAVIYRQLIRGLSASAALGLDSYTQDIFDSDLTASALLGLRYSF